MTHAAGSPGINKLANVMQNRINLTKEANAALLLDFGEIMKDYSLLTNTYPIPIPKSDYLICRSVPRGPIDRIQPGDRVLVAWVQHDAVVIDLILPASSIS